MDPKNKAVSKHIHATPQLLDLVNEGVPGALEGLARAQLVYLMEETLFKAVAPDAPAQLVTGTMELLRKIGAPQKSEQAVGTGPQVVINITRAKDREERLVLEGKSELVLEDDE